MTQAKQFSDSEIDVLISGAGIVGSILALRLAAAGMKVVVVESKPVASVSINSIEPEKSDPRTLAITAVSKAILKSISAWQKIPDNKIGPFGFIRVWDEMGDGKILFEAKNGIESDLGYIVEQTVIEAILLQQLVDSDQISLYQPVKINAIDFQKDCVFASLDNGRSLKARLVVAADGTHSSVRDLAGISYQSNSYEQTAIAGVIKTEFEHQQTARQRFLENGILALLPLHDPNHCGFVWSTSDDNAKYQKAVDEESFCNNITIASESVLGVVENCYSRQTFPLSSAQASQYCSHRLALIGDAAHRVHPLAGQGANLGIMDAEILSQEILQLYKQQRDFGLKAYLRRYERKRRSENIFMMNVFTAFKSLFESQTFPIPLLRNTGMSCLDKVEPVKQCIMHRAMGFTGDIPQYLKTPLSF